MATYDERVLPIIGPIVDGRYQGTHEHKTSNANILHNNIEYFNYMPVLQIYNICIDFIEDLLINWCMYARTYPIISVRFLLVEVCYGPWHEVQPRRVRWRRL
jgi:hypothetical protein